MLKFLGLLLLSLFVVLSIITVCATIFEGILLLFDSLFELKQIVISATFIFFLPFFSSIIL